MNYLWKRVRVSAIYLQSRGILATVSCSNRDSLLLFWGGNSMYSPHKV